MIAVNESQDVYLSSFSKLEKQLAGSGQGWLDQLRREAIHRFAELGFPTSHDEEWKYTNVAPIAAVPFQPVPARARHAAPLRFPFADLECSRLVFVNGHFSPEFSSLGALPAGAKVGSLAAALANRGNGSGPLEEHLARHASFENHAFVALNTAFMEDGAFIDIPKDSAVEKPIALLFVTTANGQPVVTHPRNLILAGRGSQVSLIEAYVELGAAPPTAPGSKVEPRNSPGSAKLDFPISSFEKPYFTNGVTEIVAGESAVIDYSRVQQESESAFHVATVRAQQARSSSVTTYSIALGAALAREEVNAVLDGEGAECLLNGLYVIGGRQHVDNHTVIDHAKPHCGSRELYKGVLDGHSTGVFNGKIIVRKDAQKTDSKQSNKNLLLSEDAVINTKPQLEIFADDVRCTHGATIGQVDPEAIFYLRSRGIGLAEARHLLVEAFAHDVIDRIKFAPLRVRLEEALFARLARSYESEAQ